MNVASFERKLLASCWVGEKEESPGLRQGGVPRAKPCSGPQKNLAPVLTSSSSCPKLLINFSNQGFARVISMAGLGQDSQWHMKFRIL